LNGENGNILVLLLIKSHTQNDAVNIILLIVKNHYVINTVIVIQIQVVDHGFGFIQLPFECLKGFGILEEIHYGKQI
jgi:hypothetical protein